MSLSNMCPLIAMVGKSLATVSTDVRSFPSMCVNVVIQFLSVSEPFPTMVTFVLPVIGVHMCLLNVPLFPSHGYHQTTVLTWNSAVGTLDMVI